MENSIKETGQLWDETALYWTDDLRELEEVAKVRQSVFSDYWDLDEFPAEPDLHDKTGQILVMRKKGKIVGGARINVVMSGMSSVLPCEDASFRIDRAVPELYRPGTLRGEYSRLFVDPTEVHATESMMLDKECLDMFDRWNVHHLVFVAPPKTARRNKINGRRLGWKVQVHDQATLPDKADYNGINMVLCSAAKAKVAESVV